MNTFYSPPESSWNDLKRVLDYDSLPAMLEEARNNPMVQKAIQGINQATWAPNWVEGFLTPQGKESSYHSPSWDERKEAIAAPFEEWKQDPTKAVLDFGPGAIGRLTPTVKSGRVGGLFKNRTTKVSQYVEQNVPKEQKILDFGAGLHGIQTKKLREGGFNVTAFDLPENMQQGLHDPNALNRQYSTVMASNVLNVQPNKESLSNLLDILSKATNEGGQIVANYPKAPRYINLSDIEMLELLMSKYNNVQKLKDIFIMKK